MQSFFCSINKEDLSLQTETVRHSVRSQTHPFQTAAVSVASLSLAALLPIMTLLVAFPTQRNPTIAIATLVGLGSMGALGGQSAKAPVMHSALRVLLGGGLAMGISAQVGQLMRMGCI